MSKDINVTRKKDGSLTIQGESGRIIDNAPNPDALKDLAAKAASLAETIALEDENRTTKEIKKDLDTAVIGSRAASVNLDLSLDAVYALQDKIDTLDAERLEMRLKADEENRPLNAEEIDIVVDITAQINAYKKRKSELLTKTKDARLLKAEADVNAYEEELAFEASNGIQRILPYEEKNLGEAVEVGAYESNSPEWHEQRKNVIGGSDVSVILGTSPFNSYNRLLATKLGIIDPTFFKSTAASLGDTYEPIIQHRFAKEHGPGNKLGKPVYTVYHTKSSWRKSDDETHGANFDGLFDSTGKGEAPDSILEIKAVSDASKWNDGPPIYYRQQVLWYMHVTGLRKGKVAVLINQDDYREFDVIPESGEIEDLVSKVKEFQDRLKKEKNKISRRQK